MLARTRSLNGGIFFEPPHESACMTCCSTWQWSLRSMFGLISGCAVVACWLRLRLAVDPSGGPWAWMSIPQCIALGCLGVWMVQCCTYSRAQAARCEILAVALLLSAFETARGILDGYMCICDVYGQRLKELTQAIANTNAILEYGFVVSCALATVVAIPKARESVNPTWFRVLLAIVSANVGALVWFCNWFANVVGGTR